MLLASISIPYSSMTCLVSNETNLSLLTTKISCDVEDSDKACSTASIQKDACCLFNNGIIESNVDLIHAQHISLAPYVLPKVQILPALVLIAPSDDNKNIFSAVERPPDVPIRILQQSFLC